VVAASRAERQAPAASPRDRGTTCADVLDVRVCWDPSCARGACVGERVLPAGEPEPLAGWRCAGLGEHRSCEDRAKQAGPWECSADGGRCEQRFARVPDDGEWECADLDGVVECRRLADAAGMIAGRGDLGWLCGPRRGGAPGETVCVDLAPDLPRGALQGWRCVFEHEGGERRICTRDREAPALARHCDTSSQCARGMPCTERRCVPGQPRPACWLDADCGAGSRCAHGTCTEAR